MVVEDIYGKNEEAPTRVSLLTPELERFGAMSMAWEEFDGGLVPRKEHLEQLIADTKNALDALAYRGDYQAIFRLLKSDLERLERCYQDTWGRKDLDHGHG